jgi:DNA-binding transcriptional LysR family regulator
MRLARWLPVIEAENLSDAVVRLGSDASTLRRGLSTLERDLGFPIAHLGPKPLWTIQPTEAGRLLKAQFDQASIAA